jgi:hypothetical protein
VILHSTTSRATHGQDMNQSNTSSVTGDEDNEMPPPPFLHSLSAPVRQNSQIGEISYTAASSTLEFMSGFFRVVTLGYIR